MMKKRNRRSETFHITARGVRLLKHKLKGENFGLSNENLGRRSQTSHITVGGVKPLDKETK